MPDVQFEEKCPCGNTLKISGFASNVRDHVANWHKVHDKHSNAMAKTMTEKPQPVVPYTWPYGKWPWTGTLTTPSIDPGIYYEQTNVADTKKPS